MSPLAPGDRTRVLGRVKGKARCARRLRRPGLPLRSLVLIGCGREGTEWGLLGSGCSCGHLVTTPLTPRLSCLLQFPVPLRPDLWGLASHEVQRRNVAYRAVQPNPVVIFDESFHQSASLFEARGVGRTQGIRFYRLVPTFDLSVRLRVVPSIYSSASPMGRKSALRREIAWILRRFQRRLSC